MEWPENKNQNQNQNAMLGQAQVGQSHSKRRKRKGAKATGPQQAPELARQIRQIFKALE